MNGKVIDATLRFVDKFTRPMDAAVSKMERSARKYKRMGADIQRTGRNITKVGSGLTKSATLPIIALGTAAVKTAASFEQGMDKVQSISGATEKQMGLLTAKAKQMGAKTKFSAREASDAFSYMAMAGWKTQDMLDGIEGVMYLAGASGEQLGLTSDIVTDALTGFNMTAKDTNKFVDLLAATANNSNTNVAMLGETFKYISPVAGALGYSARDTAQAIGIMANSGIKASQAGTSLRAFLTNMSKPTDNMLAVMKRLNLSMTDSKGQVKPLSIMLGELRDRFGKLSRAEATECMATLAGKNAMSGMLAVVNASEKDWNKFGTALDKSSGAAKKMYDTANDNLLGRLDILKSTIESIAISFGEKLMPYVERGVAKLQQLADKFNALSPAMQDKIIKFALIAAAVGPVIMVFGKMVTGIGTAISMYGKFGMALGKGANAVGKLAKTTKLFGGLGVTTKSVFGLMITPGAKVVLILLAIVAAGILVYKNWGRIKKTAKELGNSIKAGFENSGFSVKKFKDKFSELGADVKKLTKRIGKDIHGIQKFMTPVVSFIGGIFLAKTKVCFSMVGGYAGALAKGITECAKGIIKMLSGITTFLEGVFTLNFKKAFNGLKTFFSGWGSAVVSLVKMPVNGIIGAINGAISGINKLGIKIPKWVPGLGGKSFSINVQKIPMLYTGTANWKGGPAMIHDRGAEIVDLPNGSRVYPHDKSMKMAEEKGARRAGGISITISKLAERIEVRSEQDIEAIAEEIANKLVMIMENIP